MKPRLPLILLAVVIFSTALLTLLAARSLQRDELVAQRHLEERAGKALDTVSEFVQTRLQNEVDQARNAMADAVAAGGDLKRVRTMATRLEGSRPAMRRVFLFMNPWGFIWPEEEAASAEESRMRQELLAALRNAVASGSRGGLMAFSLGGNAYAFAMMEPKRQLYVGCEIAPGALVEMLAAGLRAGDGGGVLLSADGPGIDIESRSGDAIDSVLVADSLGQSRDVASGSTGSRSVLQARSLPPPLEHVRLQAYSEDATELRRTVAVRTQLYRWGIVMLALGILGGVGLLVGEAHAEVKRAQSGSEVALGVSHDLRTPIASMRVMAESLYLGHVADPGRQREFLHTIMEECERLSQLTERVLFLFRYGQDSVQYRMQRADPAEAVRAAVHTLMARYAPDLPAEPSTLHIQPDVRLTVSAGLPPVNLDRTAFSQVMLNLLDNAMKYGTSGVGGGYDPAPVRIDVDVSAHRRGRRLGWPRRTWVRVTVRDFGAGVAREHQHLVFRRFYRAPQARHDNVSGVGLGLSVCRHVMAGHGGWIDLWSRPGEGAAFSLYLPAAGMGRRRS